MNMERIVNCALAITVLLVPASAIGQDAGEASAVKAVNAAFDAALSRRDIAAIDAAWIKDPAATAIHPSSKSVVAGWEAVRKSWEGAFAAFPELSVEMKDPHLRLIGNVAVVTGIESVRGKRPGGEAVEFQAMTTNVFERRDGTWLMIHHQASRAPQ